MNVDEWIDSDLNLEEDQDAVVVWLTEDVADAAGLSVAARYLLVRGLTLDFDQSDALEDGVPNVMLALLHDYGVPYATEESLPGMWLYVRNSLRRAVRENTALLAPLLEWRAQMCEGRPPPGVNSDALCAARALFADELALLFDSSGEQSVDGELLAKSVVLADVLCALK
jgi:hypothetical protein